MKPPNRSNIFRDFFKSYTPESLLVVFQAVACHPSNQKFIHRLEYLIAEMLALPETSFGRTAVSRDDIIEFIRLTKPVLDETFLDLEDFEGFDQNKLIPLFWGGRPFYFFYSLYDRPLESWKDITSAFSADEINGIPEFNLLRQQILTSLEYQTNILLKVISIEESRYEAGELYVPSQSFIDQVSPFFFSEKFTESAHEFGDLKNAGSANLLNHASQMGKYLNQLYVKIGTRLFHIYPQVHLQVFLARATNAITLSKTHHTVFMQHLKYRLGLITMSVFKKPYLFYRLLAESHFEDFLTGIADYAFWVDENKLVLFKTIDFSKGRKVGQAINQLIDKIEVVLKKIRKEKGVGIDRAREERMLAVITENMKIYIVLVYEAFDISSAFRPKKSSAWENTWLFSIMDLKAVMEHLTSPIDFLKFLEEEKYLHANAELTPGSTLMDRFAWFLKNSNCYITIGAETDLVYFPENRWGPAYSEKNYKLIQTDIDVFTEVEAKFPGFFPDIEVYRPNVYSLSEPINLESCYLSRLSDRFIWVHLPNEPLTLTFEEYRSGAQVFAPMLADYIARFNHNLSQLLTEQNMQEFDILIAPIGFLHRDYEHFPFLHSYIPQISEQNPYLFITLPIDKGEVRTYFIFDFNHTYKIFEGNQNQGERNFILNLLTSIASVRSPLTPDYQQRLTLMVDQIIPPGPKAYAVDRLTVDNPDIDHYGPPIRPARTDEGVARRMVAIFIRKSGFAQGIYSGESAKSLSSKVYDYLQGLMETEMSKYDESFIVYAYKQLEKNEGKIEQRKLTAGMRAGRQLDYDALESLQNGMQKDSWLASAIRLLVHTALKAKPTGQRSPTEMDWSYLLALGVETLLAATNYEYINHNLLKIQITIDEYYRIEITDQPVQINLTSFSYKDSERKFQYAIKEFEKAIRPETESKEDKAILISEKAKQREKEADTIFMEAYGITYSNVILILYVLSKMPLPPHSEFPVYVLEREVLIKAIKSNLIIHIDPADIDKTISFLSLKEGIFPSDKFLYFGAMLRNRQRITLCPLIELRDGYLLFGRECIDGTLNIWSDLLKGNIPYGVDDRPRLAKFIKEIKADNARWLEEKAEENAIAALGKNYVEARIDNFKRLANTFKSREDCGEIDLLCVNQQQKIISVLDCKNLVRSYGLYHAKRNIEEFFEGKNSYHIRLERKLNFVKQHLQTILHHFDVMDSTGWVVRKAFVVTNVHFAAFYEGQAIDFVDVDELAVYLS